MCKKCCHTKVLDGARACTEKSHAISSTSCSIAPKIESQETSMETEDEVTVLSLPTIEEDEEMNPPLPPVEDAEMMEPSSEIQNAARDHFDLLIEGNMSPKVDVQYISDLILSTGTSDQVLITVGTENMERKDLRRLHGPHLPPGWKDDELWLNDKNMKCVINYLRMNHPGTLKFICCSLYRLFITNI